MNEVEVDRSRAVAALVVAADHDRATTSAGHGSADGVSSVASHETSPTLPFALLVATLAAATVAQGGFYASGRWLIGAGLVAALAAAARRRPTVEWPVGAIAVPAAMLAGWAVLRAQQVGEIEAGVAVAALLGALAIVGLVGRRSSANDHDGLSVAMIAIGVGVAATGWAGVALHVEPWGIAGPSTWRASSTLTYPNAAAAVLVVAAVVGVARRTVRPEATSLAIVTTLLFAGLGATQSRGGAVALAVGGAVLLVTLGVGSVWRAAAAPALGAAVILAGLVAGLDSGSSARPAVAVIALLAGIAVAVGMERLPSWLMAASAGSVVVGAALFAVVRLPADRLEVGSSDRAGAARAALDVIGSHRLAGVGPGRLLVTWETPGGLVGLELVHNEYLQLVAELGAIGGLLLAAVAAGVVRALVVARHVAPRWSWAAGVSALAALAVHSAFDFLWHIPAVALLGAAAFVLAVTPNDRISPERNPS